MIEVQCTSCHTRYRIDEQVLPDGLPTFKCSRCGHVFSFEPRKSRPDRHNDASNAEAGDELAGGAPDRAPTQQAVAAAAHPPRNESRSENGLTGVASDSPEAGPEAAWARSQPHQERAPATNGQSLPHEPEPVPAPDESRLANTAAAAESQSSRPSASPQTGQPSSMPFTGGDGNAPPGDNLSFDFADEEPAPDRSRYLNSSRRQRQEEQPARADDRWEVGEDDSTAQAEISPGSSLTDEQPARRRRKVRADDLEVPFPDNAGLVDEAQAPIYNRAMTHSAGFFLVLILLIGAAFGALALLIHRVPGGSATALSYLPLIGDRFVPATTPAKLVALRDVSAVYQPNKQGQRTLVISGSAENVGTNSLSIVQLTAALRDGQRRLMASQAVYCGNNVSAGMISQMTPHEIEFFQRLEPAKSFILGPSASCRFVAVFLNPPATAHAYDVSVSQAVSEAAPAVDEPAS